MDSGNGVASADLDRQLRRSARTAAGERLRSLTYFTDDDHEQVYLRSDLDADADLSAFVDRARDGFDAADAYRGTELGDYRYTIRRFERGSVVRVTAEEAGAIATAEGLTVERCEEIASALHSVLDAPDSREA
ncbi:hypothetical protein GRX01_15180 [Halobaculum sp. WSA2]|uniref:Uncharacterized protein n=1 Tax=Halobaculum saliterrae TaxID=2073113 RepID=A0A6B0SVL5_9EURY|nr:hypothetical protein [Halobaculum saliterrae]MXR42675.1 hypothetical protein [Halobaculum saliterrae]